MTTKSKTRVNQYKRALKYMFETKKTKDNLPELVIQKNKWNSEGNEKIDPKDYEAYLCEINVRAIVPKTRFLKSIIEENFKVQKKIAFLGWRKKLESHLSIQSIKPLIPKGVYSAEILKPLFSLLKYDEVVCFKMGFESPLWVETQNFIFLISPRREGYDII